MNAIVVCVDFQKETDRILAQAAGMAIAQGAPLHLIHVQAPHITGPTHALWQNRDSELARRLIRRQRQLEALARRLEAQGVEARTKLAVGVPAKAIVEYAAAVKANLVIMGSRTTSAMRHLLAGSVAAEVLRTTGTPVLLVPAAPAPALSLAV